MCYVDTALPLVFGSFRDPPQTKAFKHADRGLEYLVMEHVGALSEKGLWRQIDIIGPSGHTAFGAIRLGTRMKTTIPPFSSIRVQPNFFHSRQPKVQQFQRPMIDRSTVSPIID